MIMSLAWALGALSRNLVPRAFLKNPIFFPKGNALVPASLFTDPLFSLQRSSSARIEMKTSRDLFSHSAVVLAVHSLSRALVERKTTSMYRLSCSQNLARRSSQGLSTCSCATNVRLCRRLPELAEPASLVSATANERDPCRLSKGSQPLKTPRK